MEANKAKTKAGAKTKPAAKKVATKASTASAAAAAKAPAEPPATMKRPTAVGTTISSNFPRVDRKESVYWGGGRLYKAAGDMVRVYARESDRTDKRFNFKDLSRDR